jgi:hypothetical protein
MEPKNPRTVIRGHAFKYSILRRFPNSSEERAWREFLPRSDWPSHYTTPEFFLEPFWEGKRPFSILVYDGDKVVAVLTGLHEGNHVISGLPSRPQVCFDRAVDYSQAAHALARGLFEEAGSAKMVSLYSWTPLEILRDIGFKLRAFEGCVVLDLTLGPEVLFQQIHTSGRRDIRLAKRKGVEVFEATSEADLSAYYDVYCHWQRTSRKKIEGERVSFPVVIAAYALRSNRRLFLARYGEKIIAGSSVRFSPGGLIENAGNSSLDEYIRLKPNDLLKWKMIEWSCTEGFSRFSLGGAHPFHRKSGGSVVPIYRHRVDRSLLRRHDLGDALIEAARQSLKRIPLINTTVRNILGKRSR